MALAIGKEPLYEAPREITKSVGRMAVEGSEHAVQGVVGSTREALNSVINLGATAVDATIGETLHAGTRLVKDATLGTIDAGKQIGSSLIGIAATPLDRVVDSVSGGWNRVTKGKAGDIPGGVWEMTGGAVIGGGLGFLSGSWNALKTTLGQGLFRPVGSTVRQGSSFVGGVLGKTASMFGQVLRAPVSIGAPLVKGTLKLIGTPFSLTADIIHRFNPMPPYTRPEMYGSLYQSQTPTGYGSQGKARAHLKKFAVPAK